MHEDALKRFEELDEKFRDPKCDHALCNGPGENAFGFTEEQVAKVTECMAEKGIVEKLPDGKNRLTAEYREYLSLKDEFYS